MDNLTHTLVAVTLARTRLARAGRGSVAALVVGSNAPDLDAVTLLGGGLTYLEWHRGPSHGPLGVIGLGLAGAGGIWLWQRWKRAPATAPPAASFLALTGLAMFGAFLHILFDLPTPYGTRLFSPFDGRWFTTDWMPIVDIYLLAILAAALAFGHASAARQRNAVLALVLVVIYYGVRAGSHQLAIDASARAFGPRLPSPCASASPGAIVSVWPTQASPAPPPGAPRCLVDLAAIPTFGSPFEWHIIAHTSNGYDLHTISILDRRLRPSAAPPVALWRLTRHTPSVWSPAASEAASTATARTFLGFSRFPAVRTDRQRDGSSVVRWTDLRFSDTYPLRRRGADRRDIFTAVVRLDSLGRAIEESLGP